MKLFLVAAFIATASALSDQQLWMEFKNLHGKSYSNLIEEKLRYGIFLQNLQTIKEHNRKYDIGEESYFLGINKFADFTSDEFRKTLLFKNEESKLNLFWKVPNNDTVPSTFDWRDTNVVTEVKDQGKCNGCWAFSATGSMEGQFAIKYGKTISFSEQELIDCSQDYGSIGCRGGRMEYAFDYVKYHKLSTEKDYPFIGENNNCKNESAPRTVIDVQGYTQIQEDEDDLKQAVAFVGPISVAINADQMQLYDGGIYNPTFCSHEVDHGVLVVGYASEDGLDYWIVKNSWGASWGEKGYIRMARNKNLCAIASGALYPNLL